MAVGNRFACALSADGAPTCWGPGDSRGGTLAPRLSRLAVGGLLVCGLDLEGALTCDGSFNDGIQDFTPLDGVYTEVIAPGSVGCATDSSGVVDCFNGRWGDAEYELAGTGFHSLAAGQSYTCALDGAGEVACAGPSGVASALAGMPPGPWARLTAGAQTMCGIRVDGSAACWGNELHAAELDVAHRSVEEHGGAWGERGARGRIGDPGERQGLVVDGPPRRAVVHEHQRAGPRTRPSGARARTRVNCT